MRKNLEKNIHKAAYKLFQEKSYDDVKVEDICEVVNITKPTFYKYIGSKDQLLANFYSNVMEDIGTELVTVMEGKNYYQQIVRCFEIILNASEEFGVDLYSQLFIANLKDNKGTFDFNDSLTEIMTSLFKKAQQKGQIRNTSDPKELYLTCAKLSFGCGVIWCLEKQDTVLSKEFENGLKMVLQPIEE